MKLSPLLQPEHKTGNKVVVSIADKKAVVYSPTGEIIKEFNVYVGKRDAPTPRGQFRIMESVKPSDSEWYYGGHWLGFAYGYNPNDPQRYAGFHGWVYDKEDDESERAEPGWKTSTHGCVQMANPDVASLSKIVGVGDEVTVIDSPITPPPAPVVIPGLGVIKLRASAPPEPVR